MQVFVTFYNNTKVFSSVADARAYVESACQSHTRITWIGRRDAALTIGGGLVATIHIVP
jgi:hypothetical protein